MDVTSHTRVDEESMSAMADADVVEGHNEGFKCPISLRLMDAPVEINCTHQHVFDKVVGACPRAGAEGQLEQD